MPTWVVSALLEDDLLTLNRAIGVIRRRNLEVPSFSLGPSLRAGMTRLTCVVEGDEASTVRMANQLRKMVGVSEVLLHAESECAGREHALVRVRVSPAQLTALREAVALFGATVVAETPHDLIVEATGGAAVMAALLRALEPFGILDLARSGTLALPPAPPSEAGAERPAAATPRVATAIPA
jgi:acetolactate synthase-1/3 small subunit